MSESLKGNTRKTLLKMGKPQQSKILFAKGIVVVGCCSVPCIVRQSTFRPRGACNAGTSLRQRAGVRAEGDVVPISQCAIVILRKVHRASANVLGAVVDTSVFLDTTDS